jgi:hypothetical protein
MSEESTDTELRRLVASARPKQVCFLCQLGTTPTAFARTNVARIKDRFLPVVRYVDHEP